MQNSSKIILGIDPGTIVMGYGLIKVERNAISLVDMGILKLSTKDDAYQRLENSWKSSFANSTTQTKWLCHWSSVFGKNVQSMLKLGRAQGVAIAAAMQGALPITEYSPKK